MPVIMNNQNGARYKPSEPKIIQDKMVHALNLSIPLQVDGGYGKSWYDCK